MEKNTKILMVLTSHDQLGNTGRKTGFWLEEFAAPKTTQNALISRFCVLSGQLTCGLENFDKP